MNEVYAWLWRTGWWSPLYLFVVYYEIKACVFAIDWVAMHLFGIDLKAESDAMTPEEEMDNISW